VTKYADASAQLHNYGSYLLQCLPRFVQQFSVLKDELTLYICPAGVVPVLTFLRDHGRCQFKSVQDISGADYPERAKRFEVVYHLLSYKQAGRIRVKTYAGEMDTVPSAVGLFNGANWWARRVPSVARGADVRTGMSARLGISTASSSRTTRICRCFGSVQDITAD
jgi:NADH dehydrogenase (ubiquinone) Fe-S protein 3